MSDPLQERFGPVSLESAPADPDHPAWNSLLDALRQVSEGSLPMDALQRYHDALSVDLAQRRKDLLDLPEQTDSVRVVLGGLAVTAVVLDRLQEYVNEPGAERLADVVETLLQAQSVALQVDHFLDRQDAASDSESSST